MRPQITARVRLTERGEIVLGTLAVVVGLVPLALLDWAVTR